MPREEILRFLKAVPFEPVRVGLSDGRYILIRHPDQAVVTNRLLMVGVAKVGVSAPLVTPASGLEIAREAFWINLIHIVSIEPAAEAA
jgi:hypothetical protein